MKILGMMFGMAMGAFAQHGWVDMEGANTFRNLQGVAWNGVRYVAVGSPGLIQVSTDGIGWETVLSGGTRHFGDVVWDGKRFVAAGGEGWIAISADGLKWEDALSPTRQDLWRIEHGKLGYVISGDSGTLCHSQDMAAWSCFPIKSDNPVTSLAGNDSVLVAFLQDSLVFTSRDGKDWQSHLTGLKGHSGSASSVFQSIWNGAAFFANTADGAFATSPDGAGWSEVGSLSGWASGALCWTGRRFIVMDVMYGDLWTSADGLAWRREHSPNQAAWHALHCEEERVLAVGNSDRKYLSRDGELWQSRWTRENPFIDDAAASESLAVAVGSAGNVLRSRDGKDWLVSGSRHTVGLNGVADFRDRFIAVGDSGKILTTRDGLEWTPVPSGTTLGLHSVDRFDDRLYAVGDSAIILGSRDGVVWEQQYRFPADLALRSLAAGPGILVAVGDYGRIVISVDSTSWNPVPRLSDENILSVAWHAGGFLAVGDKGTTYASPDGRNWTSKPVKEEEPRLLKLSPAGGTLFGFRGEWIYAREAGGEWVKEHTQATANFRAALAFKGDVFAFASTAFVKRVAGLHAVRGPGTWKVAQAVRKGSAFPSPVYLRSPAEPARDARGRSHGHE